MVYIRTCPRCKKTHKTHAKSNKAICEYCRKPNIMLKISESIFRKSYGDFVKPAQRVICLILNDSNKKRFVKTNKDITKCFKCKVKVILKEDNKKTQMIDKNTKPICFLCAQKEMNNQNVPNLTMNLLNTGFN